MQKIHIIMRCTPFEMWKNHNYRGNMQLVYCGYLEVPDDFNEEVWHWCNWSCWCGGERPKECEHLLITHCNSDMSYLKGGVWYSHGDKPFTSLSACVSEMLTPKEITGHFNSIWPTPKLAKVVTVKELQELIK